MDTKVLKTKKRYVFLGLAMIAAAVGLLFFEGTSDASRLSPDQLLLKAMEKGHYIDSDRLSHKIISGDPSLLLIDIRDSAQYARYALPNSLNIPVQKILNEDYIGYFDQDQFKIVLYGNDHLIAEQAWLILTSKNFSNIYVLKNGLNGFFSTIVEPKEPLASAPDKAFELHNTRIAASYYYGVPMPRVIQNASGVGGVSETGGLLAGKKRKAITIRKKKKKKVGGC